MSKKTIDRRRFFKSAGAAVAAAAGASALSSTGAAWADGTGNKPARAAATPGIADAERFLLRSGEGTVPDELLHRVEMEMGS